MRGWLIEKTDSGVRSSLTEIDSGRLPDGEVLIRVGYSSLNYKDGLAITGYPGIVRSFPMVGGIDLAGTVIESLDSSFSSGDRVLVTGCGLSEKHWGGYAEFARVKAEWVVPVPPEFTTAQTMAIGTAGFTAMQCVDALEQYGLRPGGRDVVVTGASGGVGSVAIALLNAKGYRVAASTGRAQEADFLRKLGASEIVDRSTISAPSAKPMESERWAGAVDTVGGETLAGLIRSMSARSAIAACGMAGGGQLNTTVFPFILRGVALLGVNSVDVANAERRRIWGLLAEYLDRDLLDSLTDTISLEEVGEAAKRILAGQVRGRIVVRISNPAG